MMGQQVKVSKLEQRIIAQRFHGISNAAWWKLTDDEHDALIREATGVKTMETFTLVDDGTLDTVIRCNACGVVERFNPDIEENAIDDGLMTDEFCMREMEDTHECEGHTPHENAICDQCVAVMINSVLCHEHGCPNRI